MSRLSSYSPKSARDRALNRQTDFVLGVEDKLQAEVRFRKENDFSVNPLSIRHFNIWYFFSLMLSSDKLRGSLASIKVTCSTASTAQR